MGKQHLLHGAYILGIFLILTLTAGRIALAGTIPSCTPTTCTWKITTINAQGGTDVLMSGMYTADDKGNISLANPVMDLDAGNGNTVSLTSVSGNIDPILGFGLGASTGDSGSTFGFTFNLPIALTGTIIANSSVQYTLSSLSNQGAQIGTVGSKIVTASEVDTSVGGLDPLNKGVDVGDTFFFTGGPNTVGSPVYTASNTFTGDLAYDLMTVKVDFSLSANSTVGISGFVQQVPVPAAVWLFGSGLLGLVGLARRKA